MKLSAFDGWMITVWLCSDEGRPANAPNCDDISACFPQTDFPSAHPARYAISGRLFEQNDLAALKAPSAQWHAACKVIGMDRSTQLKDTGIRVPAAANLETWSSAEWSDGIQIDRMSDLETVVVKTQNSTYEITIINGSEGDVVVRGGEFFPQLTPAHLSGATMGGSFLKLRGIYLGFSMEFLHEGRRIITSPVRSIGVTL